MEKAYFPMFVDISEKEILIIGAGKIALRRVKTLLEFEARITLIAPEAEKELENLSAEGYVKWIRKLYQKSDITERERPFLVLAATDHAEINEEIVRLCRELKICVNVADKKEMCDFFFPSIVKTEEVVIGINSGGANPGATKRTREKIEEWLGK